MTPRQFLLGLLLGLAVPVAAAQTALRNDRYTLAVTADGTVLVRVAGMPEQRRTPEFTVLWSATDPHCTRNPSHPNHPVAPRVAVRWQHPGEPLAALNAWVGTPEFKSVTGLSGSVPAEGKQRVWEFRAAPGTVKVRGAAFSAEFVGYLQRAANGNAFGLRADGRFYPYSTPEGRRIAWRQPVWDKALFATGCTREEADAHLRAALSRTQAALTTALATRQPAVDFIRLDRRQQETLLDLAHTGGVAGLRPALIAAVLAGDWARVVNEHLYVRYAGHAPDHPRNKAFAQRWDIP